MLILTHFLCCLHYNFCLSQILTHDDLQLDPANTSLVISNSVLFHTQNHFPQGFVLSHLVSAMANSCYFEQFFISPAILKKQTLTVSALFFSCLVAFNFVYVCILFIKLLALYLHVLQRKMYTVKQMTPFDHLFVILLFS